ncbi:hypothetical protein PGB90_000821 [Kerria lacca]
MNAELDEWLMHAIQARTGTGPLSSRFLTYKNNNPNYKMAVALLTPAQHTLILNDTHIILKNFHYISRKLHFCICPKKIACWANCQIEIFYHFAFTLVFFLVIFSSKMVRNYKKKNTAPPQYQKEHITEALQTLKEGKTTILIEAQRFNIPYHTLYSRYYRTRGQKRSRQGTLQAIPHKDEKELVCILTLKKWGFDLSRMEIFDFV